MTEKQLQYFRAWREANPEKVKFAGAKYRSTHKEIIAIRNKNNYIPGAHIARYRNNRRYYLSVAQRWRNNNKEKAYMASLIGNLSRAGMTLERYNQLMDEQKGLCAICGGPPINKFRLSADHNHLTGKHRGLLCVKCNSGLGQFGDNPVLLIKAAAYLEKHNA